MSENMVECLLQVAGDSVALNTFDKLFRSGTSPQWTDRSRNETPRYSLNALFPVPEEIRLRGHQTAGHLWCNQYWDTPDDLTDMQVKRLLKERRYRFYTQQDAPKRVFWKASNDFPSLHMRLILLGADKGDLQSHIYHEGYYQGCYSPNGAEKFSALRKEMGFAV